jgi:hypothetical protein
MPSYATRSFLCSLLPTEEMMVLLIVCSGKWSSGMIPALGAGGRGFDSLFTPFFLSTFPLGEIKPHVRGKNVNQTYLPTTTTDTKGRTTARVPS